MPRRKVIIMGAAGRDFHNFNVCFRNDERTEVLAFTATQIPNIEGRIYPPELSGRLYPRGIPIYPEEELEHLIHDHGVDEVIFAYSDVNHEYVMHRASRVTAAGADFVLLGNARTMLRSKRPVIAICAVRTGCGKSQTTRKVCQVLRDMGHTVVAVRHPMPYGDLTTQKVQRFESFEDFDRHNCTIEEREEYEPLVSRGIVVYAGADYEKILARAEEEAEVIIWDGGNNDTPFFHPDLHIVILDPHRAGHELSHHPGETNLRMANVAVINKIDTAHPHAVQDVRASIMRLAPSARIMHAASPVSADEPHMITGKRVLVVEDGPTLTHGGMTYGAGIIAAQKFGAREIVDPRPYIVGTIVDTFRQYPNIGRLLPAMGYGKEQIRDLQQTILATQCDVVIIATPVDLRKVISIDKPTVRVTYEFLETSRPTMEEILEEFLVKVADHLHRHSKASR